MESGHGRRKQRVDMETKKEKQRMQRELFRRRDNKQRHPNNIVDQISPREIYYFESTG